MIGAVSLAAPVLSSTTVGAATTVASSVTAAGASFGEVLSSLAGGAAQAMKSGEATAILGLQGKASVQDVVEAVMSAQESLQTAIAVRDKAVAAYQSLSQMAI